jgi:hypothetical protein
MQRTTVELNRPQMTIWFTHIAYLRLQTHSEYVALIAFPLLQWLHKCVQWCMIFTLPVLSMNNLVGVKKRRVCVCAQNKKVNFIMLLQVHI